MTAAAEIVVDSFAGVSAVDALEALYAGDLEPTSPWLAVLGAVLPLLRVDAWQALRNEKAQGQQEAYPR